MPSKIDIVQSAISKVKNFTSSATSGLGKILPEGAKTFIEDIAAPDSRITVISKDKPITEERIKKYKDIWPDIQPTVEVPPVVQAMEEPQGFRIKVPSSTGEGETNLPDIIAQLLGEELDKQGLATESAKVLHHPYMEQVRGEGYGENVGFVTGKGVNDYNYNENTGELKYITNPFTGEEEPSEDRGLFRINNETFYDYMRRMPKELKKAGITSYEDMYDTLLNVRMAKIIYKYQGWSAWFAAPKELAEQEIKI